MGLLTIAMLYDPSPTPAPGEFEIRRPVESIPRYTAGRRSGCTITSYRKQEDDGFDQPMHTFLGWFGRLIPESRHRPSEALELITVSYICYSVLENMTDVSIEWVDSLSLHLEFDNVRGILKIFKFPSFCVLMYRDPTVITK